MRVARAIARLDRAAQRRAQAAMIAACAAWREGPAAGALAELERFGAGAAIEDCPALDALVAGPDAAGDVVDDLCRRLAGAMRREPLGHPPLRHGFDGAVASLLLARAGRAQLVLTARQPGRQEFATAGFSDAERFEAVLAGEAAARIVRSKGTPGCGFAGEDLRLSAGSRLALDCREEVLQVLAVERTLVVLRLQRTAANPRPARSHALADGALLHQAAGDIRASRHELMLAVLGRMRRHDAAPLMAGMAREPGDPSLRWQALRECLALDTEAGFRTLVALARTADDPLAAPAGALRAQLVEAHPELLAVEEFPCPA